MKKLDNRIVFHRKEVPHAQALRDLVMKAAISAADDLSKYPVVVLEDPRISIERIKQEWQGLCQILRPELCRTIALHVVLGGVWHAVSSAATTADPPSISDNTTINSKRPYPKGTMRWQLFRYLLERSLQGKTVTRKEMQDTLDCSYSSVAGVLDWLGECVKYTGSGKRSISVRGLPRKPWSQLVARANEVRESVFFADRSQTARSPESLLRRIRKYPNEQLSIGGLIGAQNWHPDINLTGIPSIDLVVDRNFQEDLTEWILRIDPGLQPCSSSDSPTMAVHRSLSQGLESQKQCDGLKVALATDCALDLERSGYHGQAIALLQQLGEIQCPN